MTGLRQRNLDLDGARLTVLEQAIKLANRPGPRRTGAGRRVVHLLAGVLDVLREHRSLHVDPSPDGLVFTSANGAPLRQNNFWNRIGFRPSRRRA